MSKEDDGGSAFPISYETGSYGEYRTEYESGMSLRDYFAARVMASLINVAPPGTSVGVSYPDNNLGFARASYAMADAMLEAKKK